MVVVVFGIVFVCLRFDVAFVCHRRGMTFIYVRAIQMSKIY